MNNLYNYILQRTYGEKTMLPSDEEIKEKIRKFREETMLKKYCEACPFDYSNCEICLYIMGSFPHIPTLRWLADFNEYESSSADCPCLLYGPEYTAEKIAEFMGE